MPGSFLRYLIPGGALLLLGGLPLAAAEEEDPAAALAELESIAAHWRQDLYELSFAPESIDRITLTDRLGATRTFQYLTFRLRNQAGAGEAAAVEARAFNQVLDEVARQNDGVRVEREGGATLAVGSGEGAVIIARQAIQPHERRVALSVLAHDERGTRIHLLGEDGGGDPADGFAFRDLGDPLMGTAVAAVRDRVEEREGRRLLTLDEIRARTLPPYDAAQRGDEGWAAGELHGVVVFDRLSDLARTATLEIHGLSNRFRITWPDGDAPAAGDYLAARFLRRTFVLHYRLPGDEFFRDRDRFILERAGWEWVPSFQRGEQRRLMAQARAFLAGIAGTAKGPLDAGQAAAFWTWYDGQRAAHDGRAGIPALPDLRPGSAQ